MLKSVDIYVLLGLLGLPADPGRTQARFAEALGLSQAGVSRSLARLAEVGLLDRQERRVKRSAVEGLLVHGVPYLLPVRLGPPVRGVPTAHSAPPLNALVAGDPAYVWPDDSGDATGTSLEPLHPSVPRAARNSPELHQLLALVDALRVGRARERALAASELHTRLSVPT